MLFPFWNHRLKRGAGMNRGVVNDDRRGSLEIFAKTVQAHNHNRRIDAAVDNVRVKSLALVIQKTKYIDLRTLTTWDLNSLSNRLPTVRNAWC